MANIINKTPVMFSEEQEQILIKEAEKKGLSRLSVHRHPADGNNDSLFAVYDEDGNHAFNYDTEGNVIAD